MQEQNRTYRIKTGLRSLAALDNAIGLLKKALARDLRKARTDDWASRLQKVVRGQNNIPKEDYLGGKEPDDVLKDSELRAKLRDKTKIFTMSIKLRSRSVQVSWKRRASTGPFLTEENSKEVGSQTGRTRCMKLQMLILIRCETKGARLH